MGTELAAIARVREPIRNSAVPAAAPRLHLLPRLAIVVFCLLSMGVGARQTFWYLSHGPVVTDFRIFMTGIDMMRSGEARDLYSFEAQRQTQEKLYPETRISGLLPFNHLAFELLFYWPFSSSSMSFSTAIMAWAIANLGVVFFIGWLLRPYTRAITQLSGVPIGIYLLAFYPVMYTLGDGQDSLLFLLFVVLSLRAMDAGFTFVAGFVLALAGFKFHLALLVAFFVLVLARKWWGLIGFGAGGLLVGGISAAMVGPGILSGYLGMLRNQSVVTPWGFIPWFMPNLRGFFQWALAGRVDLGLIQFCIFMTSGFVGAVTICLLWRKRTSENTAVAYSVAILAMILISYHLHMQDLSIAALPMLVLADKMLSGRLGGRMAMAGKAAIEALKPSMWATIALIVAVASLYLFRIAGEPFPALTLRGCLLALPVALLWMASLDFCRAD